MVRMESLDPNPIEHIWDVAEQEIGIIDVQLTNLQQLHAAIMSMWTKISKECFQRLGSVYATKNKTGLKAKRVQLGTSSVSDKVANECKCNVISNSKVV